MKRKAIILFLTIFATFSLQAKSKNDSENARSDALKAHRVHVFWQANSFFTSNAIINTQIKIFPKTILSIRTGYKWDGKFGLYGANEHQYSSGYLSGIKILHTIFDKNKYARKNRLQTYVGIGFDFNAFKFPLTAFLRGTHYAIIIGSYEHWDKIEYVKGNYQTYTLYAIAGENFLNRIISLNCYFGAGIRFKDFWASERYWNYYEDSPTDPVGMPKHYSYFSGFVMIGFNIGK